MSDRQAALRLDDEAVPFTRRSITLSIGETSVPAHVMVGHAIRPCLGLVGGIHGYEYDGMRALHELLRELQPNDLQGSLLIIPVANPLAFAAGRRKTPTDDKDLNRVFPGSAKGSTTDRLAHELCSLLRQADLVFSLHGSGALGILTTWVEYLDTPEEVGRASAAAAHASGFSDLIAHPAQHGLLQTGLAEMGVPLIEGEVGGRGRTARQHVDYYKARVHAVGQHVGVFPRPASAPQTGPPPHTWTLRRLDVAASGLLVRRVELGQAVQPDDILGEVLDLHGDTISTVRSPEAGVIGGYRDHAGVQAGDHVFTLWGPVDGAQRHAPVQRT
jgi:predicted deacylase